MDVYTLGRVLQKHWFRQTSEQSYFGANINSVEKFTHLLLLVSQNLKNFPLHGVDINPSAKEEIVISPWPMV